MNKNDDNELKIAIIYRDTLFIYIAIFLTSSGNKIRFYKA